MAKLNLKDKLTASSPQSAGDTLLLQYDSQLFGSAASRPKKEEITYLPPDLLIGDFPQRYRMLSQEELKNLAEDIRIEGITDPLLVRPHPTQNGHYQIIAGRNRRQAGKMAGLTELPCIIRPWDDARAQLAATSTNLLRRKDLLPSELAYGYKMQQDSLLSLGHAATPSELAEKNQTNRKDIYRFLQLTKLSDFLLEAVDKRRIPVIAGVELSYLSKGGQELLGQYMSSYPKIKIKIPSAKDIREEDRQNQLSESYLDKLLQCRQQPEKEAKPDIKAILEYLPSGMVAEEQTEYIIAALQFYENNSEY